MKRTGLTLGILLFLVAPLPSICASELPGLGISQRATYTAVDRGRQLYEAGDYTGAVEILRQAVEEFAAAGDMERQAIALSNLSLTYQQLGEWTKAREAIAAGEALLLQIPDGTNGLLLAQLLDVRGKLELATGQPEAALDSWRRAEAFYRESDNSEKAIASQINQAEALQSLGLYRQALKSLVRLRASLMEAPDSLLKARGLLSLGNALRAVGNLTPTLAADLGLSSDEDLAKYSDRTILAESLRIARAVNDPDTIAQTLMGVGNSNLSYGNSLRDRPKSNNNERDQDLADGAKAYQEARDAYQEAARVAPSPVTALEAQLNELSLLIEVKELSLLIEGEVDTALDNLLTSADVRSQIQQLYAEIQSQLDLLPPNRATVYARLHLAQSLIDLIDLNAGQNVRAIADLTEENIDATIQTAVQQAEALQDRRTISYALGIRGNLYEESSKDVGDEAQRRQNLLEAKRLTEQALALSQSIQAADITYQWQWQLGRILRAQGEREGAIAAYNQAVNTLQAIRSDITAANPDLQFSFRESIEPVYRELVALLLETPNTATKSDSATIPQPSQENLNRARQIIELLQLAELDNFFRAACVDANPEQIDLVDENASIFYSILLGDRLEVIFAQKDEPLRYQSVEVSQTDLKVALTFIQNYVTRGGQAVRSGGGGIALAPRPLQGQEPKTMLEQFWIDAEQMYNWLVAPFETYLTEDETLVFVLDGILRSIPMSVLYDGEQYLIEKYSVALTPGLQLLDPEPLQRQELSALTGGISEEVRDFPPLPSVEGELQKIQDTLQNLEDTSSEQLLNDDFLGADLQARIQAVPFSVVHLATHGQFSSREEETFLLTWDDVININELNALLRDPNRETSIELLVLSACQTAVGDDRAALGLAGVAVRAGARSTLASLWFVDDQATSDLMARFYEELADPNVTKAEALRQAQLSLLQNPETSDPYLWAAFVLVGNWL